MPTKSLLFLLLLTLGAAALPARSAGLGTCASMPWARIADGRQPLLQAAEFSAHADALWRLYLGNGGRPLWFRGGVPTQQALLLAAHMADADSRGLDPTDYDGHLWAGRLTFVPATLAAAAECPELELDLAFSVAVMRYVSDLTVGRVNPVDLGLYLEVNEQRREPARLLLDLAMADDPLPLLRSLEPPFRRYRTLLRALAQYRELATDPALSLALPVPDGLVRPGEPYAGASLLAYKLWRFGDLPASIETDPGVYSETLAEAVRRFQGRHGLERDAILGADTFGELNTTVRQRVRQIRLTLERWRWLPHDLGYRPIVINVPEYRLYAFEADGQGGYRQALTMDVIVGQAYPRFQTPVFEGAMSYIVFSPYWNVPWSITRRELMPQIEADPNYLTDNHFEIVASYLPDEAVLPATPDNLAKLTSGELFLRQRPGADNALGEAKFMFPNDHAVYLHGTPAKGLFYKDERAFSHGCIRLADPPQLAQHVLATESGWDRERIEAVIAAGRRSVVRLSRPLSVYVLYGTALADEDGSVRFMRDIYGHDARMARLLGMTDPTGKPSI